MTLHVVTGPPCAGKTTYVRNHRDPADLVVDYDQLAQALGYPRDHVPHKDWTNAERHPALTWTGFLRIEILNNLVTSGHTDITAWVIDTDPPRWMLSRYRAAHAHFHQIDPGLDTCITRAERDGRHPSTIEQITDWYTRHP